MGKTVDDAGAKFSFCDFCGRDITRLVEGESNMGGVTICVPCEHQETIAHWLGSIAMENGKHD